MTQCQALDNDPRALYVLDERTSLKEELSRMIRILQGFNAIVTLFITKMQV